MLLCASIPLLAGCPSVASATRYYDQLIGTPIASHIEFAERPGSVQNLAGYQPKVLQATNGNSVYVGYAKEECEVYLEYDTAGLIEGYELKGRKCHW